MRFAKAPTHRIEKDTFELQKRNNSLALSQSSINFNQDNNLTTNGRHNHLRSQVRGLFRKDLTRNSKSNFSPGGAQTFSSHMTQRNQN